MRRVGVGLCALGLALFATPARAEGALSLSVSECDSLSESALREHLALELATLGLSSTSGRLALRCEQTSVLVTFSESEGAGLPVSTRVELRDTARGARERLLALSASELVAQRERSRQAEPERAEPARAPEKTVFTEKAPELASPVAPHSPSELSAAASAATIGSPKVWLWGAALGARFGLRAHGALLLDGRFERGRQDLSRADVRYTSLSGLVGAAVRTRTGPLELSAGLGVRAGWLSLVGSASAPDEGGSLTAAWAGVALPLRASLATGRVRPFVGAEAGYVTLPVRGTVSDGSVLVEHRGGWLTATLGLALAL